MALSHASLTELAVKWLRRPHSQRGPGCLIAASECRSAAAGGEIPDAIGWRAAGHQDGSVVVEVKVSRSDFLADAHKPHRAGDAVGLGNWRYYLCPEGLIAPSELPSKWGLVYANARSQLRPIVGPMTLGPYDQRMALIEAMYQPTDWVRERYILARLLSRLGDPEGTNRRLRGWVRNEVENARAELEQAYAQQESRAQALLGKLRAAAPALVAQIEAQVDGRG